CIPQVEADAASTVKIVYKNKTKKYKRKRTYIYINGTKKSISKVPTFMKDGCYVGPASTIFKTASLGVTYTDNAHKKLTLKYNDHELVMTNGNVRAYLDGTEQVWDTAPIYAKYKSSGKKRWIVPLKDVSLALGLNYKVKNSVVKISRPAAVSAPTGTSKVVVVLDAGHGGEDSGAKGNGNLEKTMNLKIVTEAKKWFDKDTRFQVYYTRTTDKTLTLADRYELANNKNADIFISVHINSYKSTSEGTETLYNKDRNAITQKGNITSYQLATAMQKGACTATGFLDRGLVNRPNLQVLKYSKMPACLIEYGFISNRSECIKMNANMANYGKALYQSIVDFMKAKNRIG
ncbi:MAG: N-acetylmuramoyl-L-alanine amidase, partial [Eubacterium sp.]|nr:N-acetylmuramoyl-L-alanine amidase [Eubacterium sp.]